MKQLCKNKNWPLNQEYNLDKILYLLIDRPDYINANNSFIWKNKQKLYHRNYDLPACVGINKTIEWCKYNNIHRNNDKLARIWGDGYKQYYINGILQTNIIYENIV